MITLTNLDKRWLEIVFYFFCRKIFSINQKQQDVLDFINGYRWTNMFNCDILINVITKDKILLNTQFIPSKHEFLIVMSNKNCRLKMEPNSIRELTQDTGYYFNRSGVFHAEMKEEINKTEIFPRITTPNFHETIYSFLLSLRYIADIVKKIRF